MYNLLIRPFVRRMDPERASSVALRYFKLIGMIPGANHVNRLIHGNKPSGLQREVFGLQFYNPVGLGAGLDRRGDLYDELEDLGFSFVEIGPLDADATRNAIANIQSNPQDDILAACISKDRVTCFSLAYDFCDFFVVEIRGIEDLMVIDKLLDIRLLNDVYRPIVIKVPENISDSDLGTVLDYARLNGIDGIETRSLRQTLNVSEICLGRLPIIANSHVRTPEEAAELLDAGASLVELRSGLVSEGPRLVSKVLRHLEALSKKPQDYTDEAQ